MLSGVGAQEEQLTVVGEGQVGSVLGRDSVFLLARPTQLLLVLGELGLDQIPVETVIRLFLAPLLLPEVVVVVEQGKPEDLAEGADIMGLPVAQVTHLLQAHHKVIMVGLILGPDTEQAVVVVALLLLGRLRVTLVNRGARVVLELPLLLRERQSLMRVVVAGGPTITAVPLLLLVPVVPVVVVLADITMFPLTLLLELLELLIQEAVVEGQRMDLPVVQAAQVSSS